MRWLRVIVALGAAACGARTDLGAPRPISTSDQPDSGGDPQTAIACDAKAKTVLSQGTTSDVDVRIDAAYVYWNDGAHIVRVPKTGSATPEIVVDAVVDPGAFDVLDGRVVYAARGSKEVRRSDGTVVGIVSRPFVELVAQAGKTTYVVAPQGGDMALFAIEGGTTELVSNLPLTAPDSLGQGQFPQAAYDLVVDAQAGVAFVSLIGHAPFPSKVLSVALGTGNVTTLSAMPLSLPGSSLAIDSQNVYFASSFGQGAPAIFGVSRAGGVNPNAVVPTQTYCASCARTSLTSDSSAVYFSAGEFGQNVAAWTKTDGATLVAESAIDAAVTGIRSDGACVYWVVASDRNVYVAPILK